MFKIGEKVRKLGNHAIMTIVEVWVQPYEVSVEWTDNQGRARHEVLDPHNLIHVE